MATVAGRTTSSPAAVAAGSAGQSSPSLPSPSPSPSLPSPSSAAPVPTPAATLPSSGSQSALTAALAANNTHTWEGKTWEWSPRSFVGATPSARAGHTLTTTNQGTAFVIYGGQGRGAMSHDSVYIVDGTTMDCVCLSSVERAERRIGHTALDLYNHLYVFGGWNGKKYLDHGCLLDVENEHLLVEADATAQRRAPTGRRDHTVTRIARQMFLFGGWNCADQFNDVWILDRSKGQWQWSEATITGTQPNARRGHSATRIAQRIFIFGGLYGYTKFSNDLWVLDTATMEWSQPKMEGVGPSPRAWHSACAMGNSGRIIIFGGTAGRSKFFNEVWLLDTNTKRWELMHFVGEPPSPRCSHAATMIGSNMIIFGGLTTSGKDNRVYPAGDVYALNTHVELPWEEEQESSLAEEAPKAPEVRPASGSQSNSPAPSQPATPQGPSPLANNEVAPTVITLALGANSNKTTIITHTGATIKTVKKTKSLHDIQYTPEVVQDTKAVAAAPRPTLVGAGVLTPSNVSATAGTPKRPAAKVEAKEEKGKLGTPAKSGGDRSTDDVIEEIEGWLAFQFNVAGVEEPWTIRYLKLIGTELIVYEEKEKGSVLIQDGVVKKWVNKREQKSNNMEKLMEALATNSDNKDRYDELLRAIVAMPDAPPMKELVAYMTTTCTEENILFYLDVDAFRKMTDPASALAAATNLFQKYIRSGAPYELGSVSPAQRQAIKAQLEKPDITPNMFEKAQKQVGWMVAVDVMPKYLAQLRTKLSLSVPADEQFTLKSSLTEEDKNVAHCENCMIKFSFSTRRNYCRYCGLIYCNPCVSKLCTLPPQFGVGATRVRVCDMCSGVLMGRPNHVAFTFVSRKRARPLNLAGETEEEVASWMSALEQALRITEAEPKDHASALHKEGWLLKEDPTSRMFRRRYFILHHNQLFYYEMKVRRDMSLTEAVLEPDMMHAPTIRRPPKAGGFAGLNYACRFRLTVTDRSLNATAAAGATGSSSPAGGPHTGSTPPSAAGALANAGPVKITYNFAAPSEEDRSFWRTELQRAIRQQPRVRTTLMRALTGSKARRSRASLMPTASSAHHRQRSVSEADKNRTVLSPLAEEGPQGSAARSGANATPTSITPPTATGSSGSSGGRSTPSLLSSADALAMERTSSLGPVVMPPLRLVYVFALFPNPKKVIGQETVLLRVALIMNDILTRFGGAEVKNPDVPPQPSPLQSSSASSPSVIAAYFTTGVALQFSTVTSAIHFCVKVQRRVSELTWLKSDGTSPAASPPSAAPPSDAKEEKPAQPRVDDDEGLKLCMGMHVHMRSLSMDGLNDGEVNEEDDDDDDDGKRKAAPPTPSASGAASSASAAPSSPASVSQTSTSSPTTTLEKKESKDGVSSGHLGRLSGGLRMAHRLALAALPGQTLCSRDVWRIWGQTLESREIRRSKIEARESGDVQSIREDKDDDEEGDASDDDERSDDEASPHHGHAHAAASATSSSSSSSSAALLGLGGVVVSSGGPPPSPSHGPLSPLALRKKKGQLDLLSEENDGITGMMEDDEDAGIQLTELDALLLPGASEPVVLYEVSAL